MNVTQYANMTIARSHISLNEIKEGDPCIPGRSYKIDCNSCQCTAGKTLMCTKMGCGKPPPGWSDFIKRGKQGAKKTALRFKQVKSSWSNLPVLPKGRCKPGKIYRNGCRRCYCNDLGKATCSLDKNGACKTYSDGTPVPVRDIVDVRPAFKREDLKDVPTLPTTATKCQPGKTYRVSCNHCICTDKNNLICDKLLCLSFEDINRVEADERSGKKCAGSKVTKEHCVTCTCTRGMTACQQVPDCIADTRTRLSKGGNDDVLKMEIDAYKDPCVPGAIYTDNCNRCYCQPDASLRCTQKTCLNFGQSKALDEQFKRLREEEEQRTQQKGP